jgi:hypothetical protein
MRGFLSLLWGLLVGLVAAVVTFVGVGWLYMLSMGSGVNLFSIFLAAPLVLTIAITVGVAAGAFAAMWTY